MVAPVNDVIAGKLREMADVLEQQRADGFRIAAYRRAADTLETLRQPVEDIVRIEGLPGLVELPSIGRGIGSAIVEMVTTGRWSQLERLQGEFQPEHLFQTLPGIGPELAAQIHDALSQKRRLSRKHRQPALGQMSRHRIEAPISTALDRSMRPQQRGFERSADPKYIRFKPNATCTPCSKVKYGP